MDDLDLEADLNAQDDDGLGWSVMTMTYKAILEMDDNGWWWYVDARGQRSAWPRPPTFR